MMGELDSYKEKNRPISKNFAHSDFMLRFFRRPLSPISFQRPVGHVMTPTSTHCASLLPVAHHCILNEYEEVAIRIGPAGRISQSGLTASCTEFTDGTTQVPG